MSPSVDWKARATRLEARLSAMEGVLEEVCEGLGPFAGYHGSDQFLSSDAPDYAHCAAVSFRAGDYRNARAALAKIVQLQQEGGE